ncbi:MAG: Crp/Fnr family transcriptional regulator [Deferribacteraceae bacterium]|jgi:CRP-like cAMP-binding protein|nr:Crp/Fnr family transcriptional regulator [Deferribacteraceae bacterium]
MEYIQSKPWVPPLLTGRLKSFLYKNGRIMTYKKGAVIVNEDDYLDDVFIVKSGILSNSIMHHALNKSVTMCGIRFAGHISGYATFTLREPAPVRIMALSKTTISRVSFAQLDQYLDSQPDLKTEFYRHCARSLRSDADALLAMATATTEERFWVLTASIFSTLDIIKEGQEWIEVPFKLSRESVGALLYVSVMTIDRLYAGMVKGGVMRRNDRNIYELKVSAIKEGMHWVAARHIAGRGC